MKPPFRILSITRLDAVRESRCFEPRAHSPPKLNNREIFRTLTKWRSGVRLVTLNTIAEIMEIAFVYFHTWAGCYFHQKILLNSCFYLFISRIPPLGGNIYFVGYKGKTAAIQAT